MSELHGISTYLQTHSHYKAGCPRRCDPHHSSYRGLQKLYPGCHITWITRYPDILPAQSIDTIRAFEFEDIFIITRKTYDIAINLCKDEEAAMLLAECNAEEKRGFIWKDGHISIANKESEHKLLTGLFDELSKANTKSYLQEIFEICGLTYDNESYVLNVDQKWVNNFSHIQEQANGKKNHWIKYRRRFSMAHAALAC